MPENTLSFDFTDFYDEGFEKTTTLEQAIYVFQDGSLWSGYSEGGDGYVRDVDHGSIEAFLIDPSMDRYHQDFWSVTLKEMVQVIPETRIVLLLKENEYTDKQLEVIDQLEEAGFSIEILESTLGPKQVEEQQRPHTVKAPENKSYGKKETQTVRPDRPGSEEFIIDLQNNPFMYEVTTLFTDFKQEIDKTLSEVPKSTEQFVTRAEVESLLTEHMDRIEVIIAQHTADLTKIKEPTNEQVQVATQKMKRDIKTILSDFKVKLDQYLTGKKERTIGAVTETLDDIRLGFKNEITYHILTMNHALKAFSQKIDQMMVLEVKDQEINSASKAPTTFITPAGTKSFKQEENSVEESKTTENEAESQDEKLVPSENELLTTTENTPNVYITAEEHHQRQIQRIEALCQQVGKKVTADDRLTLAQLTPSAITNVLNNLEAEAKANQLAPNMPQQAAEEVELEI